MMRRHPVVVAGVVLVALSLLASFLRLQLSEITEIAIYVLYGAGLNLLVGYTGLVPFGASVFFGCATYVVAIFLRSGAGDEIAALALCTAFSLVLGLLLGLLILRRRGLYFSLLTLAASQIAFEIAYKWTGVTGGENGLQNAPLPLFGRPLALHAFTLATVLAALWLLWRLAHAPFGRALAALRENEQRVTCLGYDTFRLKLAAFCLCAVFVGFAGGLLALLLRGAYADNLNWAHAGDALLMVVFGGVHQFLGPLWGAIAFVLLQDRLSTIAENWWLIFAPIIIVFALGSPEGMVGLAQRLTGRVRWTLTRPGIPPRPAAIAPLALDADRIDRARPVLTVRGLTKRFGALTTAREIDLDVHPCRLHSFIGPNGAGKTTFFNMLTGLVPPNAGRIELLGHDITGLAPHRRIRRGLSRSFQILSIFPHLTAFENVRIAVQAQGPHAWGFWRDAHADAATNARCWTLLDAVGLADRAAEDCRNLAHGERRLLDIAMSLASNAHLLLLDEPLAGLGSADREVVGRLIRRLASSHAVLLIEHDIDRVLALSDRITVLHGGRLIADGKPHEVVRDPAVIAAYLGQKKDEDHAAPVPLRRPARGGKPVLAMEEVRAGYGGSLILDGVSLEVREGEALAILGRNGVGKTTALRAITGTVAVAGGRIAIDGHDVTNARPFRINRRGVSLVPEGRRLFPNLSVADNLLIAARPGGASLDDILELFPKLRPLRLARAENLSGGERQMVAVGRALMAPSRLILLDEPFEGLAPAIVADIKDAVLRLRERASLVIVEHHAESILSIVDRAVVLVNGQVAYSGDAAALAADQATQARLLGVVQAEAA